jgi:hypothetical protein
LSGRASRLVGVLEVLVFVEITRAVGKVFADKQIRVDALEVELGRVWCPLKGIECKELGEN